MFSDIILRKSLWESVPGFNASIGWAFFVFGISMARDV